MKRTSILYLFLLAAVSWILHLVPTMLTLFSRKPVPFPSTPEPAHS